MGFRHQRGQAQPGLQIWIQIGSTALLNHALEPLRQFRTEQRQQLTRLGRQQQHTAIGRGRRPALQHGVQADLRPQLHALQLQIGIARPQLIQRYHPIATWIVVAEPAALPALGTHQLHLQLPVRRPLLFPPAIQQLLRQILAGQHQQQGLRATIQTLQQAWLRRTDAHQPAGLAEHRHRRSWDFELHVG